MSVGLLREIPAVHELLGRPAISELCAATSIEYVTAAVRQATDEVRTAATDGDMRLRLDSLERRIVALVARTLDHTLRPVINATGVILHTNLGRAPMSAVAARAACDAAANYTNLEFDLHTGRRGKRDSHAAGLLQSLLGVPAVVVNNNAAAVFLVLHELAGASKALALDGAAGGEAVVSRGELVEIGGSFRIPDIMQRSGAVLREVGTTNRTRLPDYEQAITERTKLLLRVHPSNFRMVGFTERPTLVDLASLAQRVKVPLVEDIGSGCLFDLRSFGIDDEPMVQQSLRDGADLVTFSGDKLMGGPQAGIIAGRPDLVERVRRNPLFRALRADKMTYAALGATLRLWISGQFDAIPTLRMIRMSAAEIATRAAAMAATLRSMGWEVQLCPGESVAGGGSTPGQTLPTTLVSIPNQRDLQHRLRMASLPVIARVAEDRVLLDLRTVFPEQDDALLKVLGGLQ